MIALDTHVVVWLYDQGAAAVPDRIAQRLEEESVRIAPAVHLELTYLHEIGRVTVTPDRILGHLQAALDVAPDETTAQALVTAARPLTWTRDPFDRLICAHAGLLGVDLVTKDQRIHAHHDRAVW